MFTHNTKSAFEAGFASRPPHFYVICMNSSGRIHIVLTVINSLVDVAKGVQLVICRPLITPHSATW